MAINDWQIGLIGKLDGTKSKQQLNDDIEAIKKTLKELEIKAKLDPNQVKSLEGQLNNLKVNLTNVSISPASLTNMVNQINSALSGIKISNVNIGSSNTTNIGQQIGNNIAQGVSSGVGKATTSVKSFSKLVDSMKSQKVELDTDGLIDDKKTLDAIKQTYSEFGQVKITNKVFDSGELKSFRVNIEQANGDLKEIRSFMMQLSNDGKSFVFPDDVIKGTEKYVQHLDAAKNITNATGDALNEQKQKLAEQDKYYAKLEQATKEQLAIEEKRITAGEKQLEILDKQSKRRDSRISYNEGQIDKKGLTDISRVRDINDMVSAGNEKYDNAFAKEIDKNITNLSKLKVKWQEQGVYVDEFKAKVEALEMSLNSIDSGDVKGLNSIRQQMEALSKEASTIADVNKIQLLSNGGIKNDYATQIAQLEGNFRRLGLSQDEVNQKVSKVSTAFGELKTRVNQPFDESNYQEIINLNNVLQRELIESSNEYTKLQASFKGFATEQQRLSLANTIEAWNQKNTKVTREVRNANEAYILSLRDLSNEMLKIDFDKINTGFKQNETSMRALNRLGKSLKEQFEQAYQSFTMWLSASSLVMKVVSETKEAITELKEVNTLLTEISKANDKLTKEQLNKIADDGFDTASKYGKSVTHYLSGVQEASRAGYENAEAIAELSTAIQGAGDVTDEVANSYVIATDKAYKLNGSVKALTEVFDGTNYITNKNAVNMTELAEAMTIVGSTAASFGIEVDETTAAIATMSAVTQQSGSEVARAFRAILLNIRQVSDEEEGIDAEGLTKYEKACNALGVSLKETKNGVLETRDAMDVLKELSEEYIKLDENDLRRTELLNSVGGKLRATQLDALLRNFDTYETMLQQYADGTGSMAREAEKTANSWEGSLNRLSNTWTDTIENVANSDAIITAINSFNGLLNIINEITSSLGSLGTISVISGLLMNKNGIGERTKFQWRFVLRPLF